ncbi:hypothetical protein [Nocardiopsis sp. CNT312]|uniref:hypothetical protein n=1 Tax=Nocardiopsis sp. CNT312 TaxID=1137268 RepID=UPI0004B03E18|nr:hypothetical protein [Nocardiopsis sp. CNT312]
MTTTEHDDGYVDVNARLTRFLREYPDGALGPLNPAEPYRIQHIEGTDEQGRAVKRTFLVYTAAAYRSADDPLPGIGTAWTPFPGRTEYTQDAELQNAETAAWGRAIRAVMPSERRKGPLAHTPRQPSDLSPRHIHELRTRIERARNALALKVVVAEVDEARAHGQLPEDTVTELMEQARQREAQLTERSAPRKPTDLAVVPSAKEDTSETAASTVKSQNRSLAEQIASRHGMPPAPKQEDK